MTPKPKWRERWDELTRDPETGQPFKYLEIKGWYDWQEKHYTTDYIRDYFGKDEDPDYGSPEVRVLQRWIMDWLRRQRGRMRHTLPNDPDFLIRRMNLGKEDGNQAGWTLVGLLEGRGAAVGRLEEGQCFLRPTNQQVRDQKWENKRKQNKNKHTNEQEEDNQEDKAQSQPATPQPATPGPPTQNLSIHGVPCTCGSGSPGSPCKYCGQPKSTLTMGGNGSAPKPATARPAPTKKLGWDPHDINEPMAGYTIEQIRKIVRYHWDESENSFWRDKCSSREFFERNLPKMAKQIPVSWLHPKKVGKKSFMHPTPRPQG